MKAPKARAGIQTMAWSKVIHVFDMTSSHNVQGLVMSGNVGI